MIEVAITDKMKKRAQRKARQLGKLKCSITRGKGNIAGFLGEEVVGEFLQTKLDNTKDYDLIYQGLKYDVKTKRCTSEPKADYDCSIAAYNTVQKCDRYIFVRIENINGRWGRAWILGFYDKTNYFLHARKLRKGERDGSNGFLVKANCYNIPIAALNDIEDLRNTQ